MLLYYYVFSFFLACFAVLCCACASPLCNWIWFCKQKHGSLNANIFALIFHQHQQQQQQQWECMKKGTAVSKERKKYYYSPTFMFRASFALLCKLESRNERTEQKENEEENVNPRWNIFFLTLFFVFAHTPQSERSFEIICSGDDFGNSCSKLFMLTNVDNTILCCAVQRRFIANTLTHTHTHAIYANACTPRDKCKWRAEQQKLG